MNEKEMDNLSVELRMKIEGAMYALRDECEWSVDEIREFAEETLEELGSDDKDG